MLDNHQSLAIYMDGHMKSLYAKMAYGIMRYAKNPIACVVDTEYAGRRVDEVGKLDRPIPIVGSVAEAKQLGAEVFVLGIAPSGGKIPENWITPISEAIQLGLSVVNGLHDTIHDRFGHLVKNEEQWIWDIRVPNFIPQIGKARALSLNNKRLLMVGTDMAVGKMTAGLEIYQWALQQNIKTSFIATGQIGITIMGKGIPLDAFKVDHACGAVEHMVMDAADSDLIIVEGQGSLLNPGSTATLPLMRGTCPTHLVLCHRANMKRLQLVENIKVPPLAEFIKLNEAMASVGGVLAPAKCIGIALNTVGLDPQAAEYAVKSLEDELALPVTDVLRYGADKLGKALA